jgi:hypothetical protein
MSTTHGIQISDQAGASHMIVYAKSIISNNEHSSVTLELKTRFLPGYGFHKTLNQISVTKTTEMEALKEFRMQVSEAIKRLG